ncbi:unnamed protein product [Cunninghamella echinulata]
MTASSSPILNHQVHSKYTLKICQQPLRARLCSFKDKVDRRPLDPPPIIQLISDTIDESKYPRYFLYATLVSEDGNDNIAFLENNRTTAGDVVQSLYRLRDFGNNDGVFFIFSDISIRMEGFFRLRFSLFEIIGSYSQCKCSVLSDVFQVYSPKSFPGMSESTLLTRLFSEQGVRIRIRKEVRTHPSSNSSKRKRSSTDSVSSEVLNRKNSDDHDYSMGRILKDQDEYQHQHKKDNEEEKEYNVDNNNNNNNTLLTASSTVTNLNSVQSIMSMSNILLSPPSQASPKLNANDLKYLQSQKYPNWNCDSLPPPSPFTSPTTSIYSKTKGKGTQ